MLIVFVPIWIVYAMAIWSILWGLVLLWLAIAVIRYVRSKIIYVEENPSPEEPPDRPPNLIILNGDEVY